MAGPAKSKNQVLVLLDAQAVIHRAYHALPEFSSARGEPTGALYGLCLMLFKIIDEFRPDYLAACFDRPEPTYRHQVYLGYKAQRPKTDPDLAAQIDRAKDVFQAFNIPVYEKSGFEADDLLGTIVQQLKNSKKLEIIIASGDLDTLQLVRGRQVRVYTLKKGIKDTVLYDETAVRQRFGFGPELLPDFKGLRGDPSDNIPGVPGIGEKTAAVLIQNFGSLEEIYRRLKDDRKIFERRGIKKRALELLLAHRDEALFAKTLSAVRTDAPIDFSLPERTWRQGLEAKKILTLLDQLEFRTLRERLPALLAAPAAGDKPKPAVAAELFPPAEPEQRELEVALWLIDSNLTNPTLEDVLRWTGAGSLAEARLKLMNELKIRRLAELFEKIERPLIPVIKRMEERGVKIDRLCLKVLSAEYHRRLNKLEKEIWRQCGVEFNLNSPKQLSQTLFDKLNLKVKGQKKTSGGGHSTRESELVKIKDRHPSVPLILEYRELQKLLSTYIDNIPQMLSPDGRLRARFNQAGTTTGRLSCDQPNLQNIPIKTELGRRIRRAFAAEDGFQLLAFDYSQIELRVAALMSGDSKMIEVFKSGGDIHRAVAAAVFKVPPQQVDYEMRRRAKVINFGLLYGMGVNALRANLNSSKEEAQKFLDDYFRNFSGLADYWARVKKEVYRLGYTETLFGRRRSFPAINSKIDYIRSAAERMAINAPFQGTAADIIKLAMVRIDQYLQTAGLREEVFLILQIHDELVYEVRERRLAEVAPALKNIMENVLEQKKSRGLPLRVNVEVGRNWGEMKPIDSRPAD